MARASSPRSKRKRRYPREQDYPLLFNVEGKTYHVVFVDEIERGAAVGGCSDRSGGRVIALSRKQSKRELLATSIHELMHSFEFESGLELGHARIRRLEYLIVAWLEATGVV
jgi:hypothetical protein